MSASADYVGLGGCVSAPSWAKMSSSPSPTTAPHHKRRKKSLATATASSTATAPAAGATVDNKPQLQFNKCLNEKRRRQQENAHYEELFELIKASIVSDMNSPLAVKPDKCAILQQTVDMIKQIREAEAGDGGAVQQGEVSSSGQALPHSLLPYVLEALDGFLFLVDREHRIKLVSENVSKYIKFAPEDLHKKGIYSIIHGADHDKFISPFSSRGWMGDGAETSTRNRSFTCRLLVKSSTDEEASPDLKETATQPSAQYELMQITAVLSSKYPGQKSLVGPPSDEGGDEGLGSASGGSPTTTQQGQAQDQASAGSSGQASSQSLNSASVSDSDANQFLLCIARRVPAVESRETPVEQFTTKLDPRGKILEIDVSGVSSSYLQFLNKDLSRKNFGDLCLASDLKMFSALLNETLHSGQATSTLYKLKLSECCIQIQTKCKYFPKGPQEDTFIMATHSIISTNQDGAAVASGTSTSPTAMQMLLGDTFTAALGVDNPASENTKQLRILFKQQSGEGASSPTTPSTAVPSDLQQQQNNRILKGLLNQKDEEEQLIGAPPNVTLQPQSAGGSPQARFVPFASTAGGHMQALGQLAQQQVGLNHLPTSDTKLNLANNNNNNTNNNILRDLLNDKSDDEATSSSTPRAINLHPSTTSTPRAIKRENSSGGGSGKNAMAFLMDIFTNEKEEGPPPEVKQEIPPSPLRPPSADLGRGIKRPSDEGQDGNPAKQVRTPQASAVPNTFCVKQEKQGMGSFASLLEGGSPPTSVMSPAGLGVHVRSPTPHSTSLASLPNMSGSPMISVAPQMSIPTSQQQQPMHQMQQHLQFPLQHQQQQQQQMQYIQEGQRSQQQTPPIGQGATNPKNQNRLLVQLLQNKEIQQPSFQDSKKPIPNPRALPSENLPKNLSDKLTPTSWSSPSQTVQTSVAPSRATAGSNSEILNQLLRQPTNNSVRAPIKMAQGQMTRQQSLPTQDGLMSLQQQQQMQHPIMQQSMTPTTPLPAFSESMGVSIFANTSTAGFVTDNSLSSNTTSSFNVGNVLCNTGTPITTTATSDVRCESMEALHDMIMRELLELDEKPDDIATSVGGFELSSQAVSGALGQSLEAVAIQKIKRDLLAELQYDTGTVQQQTQSQQQPRTSMDVLGGGAGMTSVAPMFAGAQQQPVVSAASMPGATYLPPYPQRNKFTNVSTMGGHVMAGNVRQTQTMSGMRARPANQRIVGLTAQQQQDEQLKRLMARSHGQIMVPAGPASSPVSFASTVGSVAISTANTVQQQPQETQQTQQTQQYQNFDAMLGMTNPVVAPNVNIAIQRSSTDPQSSPNYVSLHQQQQQQQHQQQPPQQHQQQPPQQQQLHSPIGTSSASGGQMSPSHRIQQAPFSPIGQIASPLGQQQQQPTQQQQYTSGLPLGTYSSGGQTPSQLSPRLSPAPPNYPTGGAMLPQVSPTPGVAQNPSWAGSSPQHRTATLQQQQQTPQNTMMNNQLGMVSGGRAFVRGGVRAIPQGVRGTSPFDMGGGATPFVNQQQQQQQMYQQQQQIRYNRAIPAGSASGGGGAINDHTRKELRAKFENRSAAPGGPMGPRAPQQHQQQHQQQQQQQQQQHQHLQQMQPQRSPLGRPGGQQAAGSVTPTSGGYMEHHLDPNAAMHVYAPTPGDNGGWGRDTMSTGMGVGGAGVAQTQQATMGVPSPRMDESRPAGGSNPPGGVADNGGEKHEKSMLKTLLSQ